MEGEDVDTLEELVNRLEWMADAARKGQTDLFFIERGGDTAPAKTICRGCGVWAQCAPYALERGERHGVWGGMAPLERKRRRAA
jgi:WhiB family redox-sensing transcriptional regulator